MPLTEVTYVLLTYTSDSDPKQPHPTHHTTAALLNKPLTRIPNIIYKLRESSALFFVYVHRCDTPIHLLCSSCLQGVGRLSPPRSMDRYAFLSLSACSQCSYYLVRAVWDDV